MATKKKASKKPTYAELLEFIKKYEVWYKAWQQAQTKDSGGGDTPPPPKWP
jgi:hypothetical protein